MEKCAFCGSKELRIKTPYLKPVTHEPITTWCCKAQAKNQEYIRRNYDPTRPYQKKITTEDASKL